MLEESDDKLSVDFHYCPLVTAWQKLTDDEKLIGELCDIAMDGDRGIVDVYDDFKFELGETIAVGDKVCQIRISKNK